MMFTTYLRRVWLPLSSHRWLPFMHRTGQCSKNHLWRHAGKHTSSCYIMQRGGVASDGLRWPSYYGVKVVMLARMLLERKKEKKGSYVVKNSVALSVVPKWLLLFSRCDVSLAACMHFFLFLKTSLQQGKMPCNVEGSLVIFAS